MGDGSERRTTAIEMSRAPAGREFAERDKLINSFKSSAGKSFLATITVGCWKTNRLEIDIWFVGKFGVERD